MAIWSVPQTESNVGVGPLEHFEEKWRAILHLEIYKNKDLEDFCVSTKRRNSVTSDIKGRGRFNQPIE